MLLLFVIENKVKELTVNGSSRRVLFTWTLEQIYKVLAVNQVNNGNVSGVFLYDAGTLKTGQD